MSTQKWSSMVKARIGQRGLVALQVLFIVTLGSLVFLRDCLGVGTNLSLDTAESVDVASKRGDVAANFSRNKRRTTSTEKVESKSKYHSHFSEGVELDGAREHRRVTSTTIQEGEGELESATLRTEGQFSVKDDFSEKDKSRITDFDKAKEKRRSPQDNSNEISPKDDANKEAFVIPENTRQEFTISEDLQDLRRTRDVHTEKVKPAKGSKSGRVKDDNTLKQNPVDPFNAHNRTTTLPGSQRETPVKTSLREPEFSGKAFSLGKSPSDWDQQRMHWFRKYPWLKRTKSGKLRMLLISGSSPWACKNPVGDHVLLKSLKNKIDYARQHDIELFYNLVHLERNLTSYWAKLPIIRKLMLTHPEIEWFFWVDSDAMFTDMLFEVPLERYDGYNIVMWGWEENLYKNRSWIAINDGAFLFRNCQWSLDLLDMWAPMGPEGDVRTKWGEFFSEYMSERPPDFPADDQSALVYLILNKTELQSKIKLEWEYELSGYWELFVNKFEDFMTTPGNHPGLGGKTWPFITHFTGCQPCTGRHNPKYSGEECALQMTRAYNFADNQVLQPFGYMHENLNSSHLRKMEIEEEDSYNVLEKVGPDPWTSASKSYGL